MYSVIAHNKLYMGFLGAFLSLFVFWIIGEAFSFFHESGNMAEENIFVTPDVKKNPFDSVALVAKSAIVYDMLSGAILFDKASEAQLPLASLTKVMTALLAEETLSSEGVVGVGLDAIREEGDSGLFAGEEWSTKNLINIMLVSSSNDGAYALAQAVLAQKSPEDGKVISVLMNKRAAELNLEQTFFINSSGLDVHEAVSGGYGSAKDFSLLLAHVLAHYPDILEATSRGVYKAASLNGKNHTVLNTNEYVESIPGIRASKTGFTDLAGGNVAIIFEIAPLHPVIVVVLGSTEKERFSDAEMLVSATTRFFGAYSR